VREREIRRLAGQNVEPESDTSVEVHREIVEVLVL
jgi:hypothetical protein